MAEYRVKITLSNGEKAEYGCKNSTITPTDVPPSYTTAEYQMIQKILLVVTAQIAKCDMLKLEIEKETE